MTTVLKLLNNFSLGKPTTANLKIHQSIIKKITVLRQVAKCPKLDAATLFTPDMVSVVQSSSSVMCQIPSDETLFQLYLPPSVLLYIIDKMITSMKSFSIPKYESDSLTGIILQIPIGNQKYRWMAVQSDLLKEKALAVFGSQIAFRVWLAFIVSNGEAPLLKEWTGDNVPFSVVTTENPGITEENIIRSSFSRITPLFGTQITDIASHLIPTSYKSKNSMVSDALKGVITDVPLITEEELILIKSPPSNTSINNSNLFPNANGFETDYTSILGRGTPYSIRSSHTLPNYRFPSLDTKFGLEHKLFEKATLMQHTPCLPFVDHIIDYSHYVPVHYSVYPQLWATGFISQCFLNSGFTVNASIDPLTPNFRLRTDRRLKYRITGSCPIPYGFKSRFKSSFVQPIAKYEPEYLFPKNILLYRILRTLYSIDRFFLNEFLGYTVYADSVRIPLPVSLSSAGEPHTSTIKGISEGFRSVISLNQQFLRLRAENIKFWSKVKGKDISLDSFNVISNTQIQPYTILKTAFVTRAAFKPLDEQTYFILKSQPLSDNPKENLLFTIPQLVSILTRKVFRRLDYEISLSGPKKLGAGSS